MAGVGSQPEAERAETAWNTYIWVDSADEASARARDAGGSVLLEPLDVADAGRMAVLADASGAVLRVWQAKQHRGAQLVNERGTWNFSELNTHDPEGAKAFYGEVFGWEVNSLGPDGGGAGFWRLPGYGEFLEQRDPGMRQRVADLGGPEGFEDAVAWLTPMTSGNAADDRPPHWSITFAMDDADGIADRATRLGGKVLRPPVDAPWVRMAVLSDPRGAVFTASRFTPPT